MGQDMRVCMADLNGEVETRKKCYFLCFPPYCESTSAEQHPIVVQRTVSGYEALSHEAMSFHLVQRDYIIHNINTNKSPANRGNSICTLPKYYDLRDC